MTAQARTVLVIDDAADSRIIIRRLLEMAGHRVQVAENGLGGVDRATSEPPDLILLDFMMPDVDGPEVVRRLRGQETTRNIPVIMLTSSQDIADIESAFEAGADDYMTKPVERRILTARVEATLRAAEDRASAKRMVEIDRERNELLNEFREAARVQQARLPASPVKANGWAIVGALIPSRHVGGDFFDVLSSMDGDPILTLVDVSGHGLAAAMVAGLVGPQLRALAKTHAPVEAMRLVNMFLAQEGANKYACVGTVQLGRGEVLIVNAGLPPVSLLRNGECVALVEGAGPPPGMIRDSDYEVARLEVRRGDCLVMMSDGLTEPFGGADRVQPSLTALRLDRPDFDVDSLGPTTLADNITSLLKGINEGDRDDATLVLAQYSPA